MKEYAIIYSCDQFDYPFTAYIMEDEFEKFIKNIEDNPKQHIIEYYEI